MSGPLHGLRVLEFEAIGPVPHAVSLLTSLGAEAVRVRRPHTHSHRDPSPFAGITTSADLTDPAAVAEIEHLIEHCDVLIEGYRPGVLERRGLGPDVALARNPGLIYARMTGWGQTGPRASEAGHDLNYIGLTGALDLIGTPEEPLPPLNLVGDYGGGSMLVVIGILAALHERARSGRGQVVDAAIVDGTATMLAPFAAGMAAGVWKPQRAANVIDGGAPYYRTYRCADGRFVAVGAIEEPFYRTLTETLGLDDLPDRHDRTTWPVLRERFAEVFATADRDTWAARFAGTDACVTPVLTLDEANDDAHLQSRGVLDAEGRRSGAPRFSRSATGPLGGSGTTTDMPPADIIDMWRNR
ncbi:CaiB/BaiF CoA transferase family protein [Enemella sp. A6]|uniref:CaiB/BaiF CoA transferase family protein n=1 Tax=Enemella sp. A6 TaxID=3440152 RepID=UPI003EB8076D